MRKVFIDCGANNGCSVKLFSEVYSDYQDFSVYSFECSDIFYSQLKSNGSKINFKEFFPIKKAVWISDGKKKYDGWKLVDTNKEDDLDGVEAIDISKFILDNFSKEDYIVFKIDIEGAEYKVIEKMHSDGSLSYINEFYGELHGPKKGYTEQHNVTLLNHLNDFGLCMYNWDALDSSKFELIQIVPFGTEGSFTNKSSSRVGHAYKYEDNIMEKITFCIPSKNNLRYLKWCLPSIRNNAYRKDHDIIVFVDKDTDGTVDWLKEVSNELNVKYIVNPDLNNSLYGIGRAYDKCISEATTDVVVVFHADMYLCKDADLKMYEKLTEESVVCATRIEPPLHPAGKEKIVMDFGMWPELNVPDGFKEEELNSFVEMETKNQSGNVTYGCFAPWMVHKKNIVKVGGHDPVMRSAREDSDIFNRFVLGGLKLIQVRDGFVYHLTCRGGQFEHGILTSNHSEKSKDWQDLMQQSTWDYIRKWGTPVKHDDYLNPIINPKYDIGFVLNDSNYEVAKFIEPWVSTIYLDSEEMVNSLISELQVRSAYNMSDRIKLISDGVTNDVIIECTSNDINHDNARWITMMNEIVNQSDQEGLFGFDNFSVQINKINDKLPTLIPIQNEFLN